MPYRDIITLSRLSQANTGEVVADLGGIEDEAKAVITGVSSLLRQRLGRVLIVEAISQRLAEHHWQIDETSGQVQFRTYADEQPVIQVDTGPAGRQGTTYLTAARRMRGEITYYAGWRRPDQVLSSPGQEETKLPTGAAVDIDDLTTLPPTLPAIMQEVAVDIALHVLARRDHNLGQRSTRTVGGQQLVVDRAEPGFIGRQLARLSRFDRSHIPGASHDREALVTGGFQTA
jgi:hypothetical protein